MGGPHHDPAPGTSALRRVVLTDVETQGQLPLVLVAKFRHAKR